MLASRRIAVWTAVGMLGIVGMVAGCGDDESSSTTGNTTMTTSTGGSGGTGMGGSGGTGMGGSGGTGMGGSGGMMGQNFGFTLSGTTYNPHVGSMLYVSAVAAGESAVTQIGTTTVASNGTFTVTGQLLGDKAYTVGWYVDINGNEACDPAPNDHVWTEDIPTVTAAVTLTVQHNVNFGACQ